MKPALSQMGRWILQRPWCVLVVALIAVTIIFVAGQGDFVASDPLWYAANAHAIDVQPHELFALQDDHPFVMRLGLIAPLAMLYRLFGVSTLVSNLPGLFAALGVLLVIYAAAPTPRAKLLGMLFAVASKPLVFHASVLNVDLPCAALMACSILWLSRRDRPRGDRWITGAMLVWFAAFMVKETALWCVPVWLYAIVFDLRAADVRRVARAYAPAFAIGAVLAIGYLIFCDWLWGNPWARFSGIQKLAHTWSMHGRSTSEWVDRLTTRVPQQLWQLFRLTLVPLLLAPWLVRGRDRIWCVATATMVLMFWFGSSSLSTYSPLPVLPRMMMPLLPFILVTATLATDQAIDRVRDPRWRLALVLGVVAAIGIPGAMATRWWIARKHPETNAYAALRDAVATEKRRVVLVCGDPRCPAITGFYFGFEPPTNFSIVFAPDFPLAPPPNDTRVFAIVNFERSAGSDTLDPRGDKARQIDGLGLPPVVSQGAVRLFDAGDGRRLWEALH